VVTLASLWGLFIRFVAPVSVLIVFLWKIGWLQLSGPAEPPPPAIEQTVPSPAQPSADES
jgi:hypothetical protein